MQDYKYVQRSLTAGASVIAQDGSIVAQNFSEFMSYLGEMYLAQGYTLLGAPTLLRYVAPSQDAPQGYLEYGYHLVKELNVLTDEDALADLEGKSRPSKSK